MTTDPAVVAALQDIARACERDGASWALIGGQALIAYGVPRYTEDADALVDSDKVGDVAQALVEVFGWAPLAYDAATGDYAVVAEVTVHYMDDPVLFDVGQERAMIPLRTPLGLPVELLAAQHPVEVRMVEEAVGTSRYGAAVPVAPLGGVLLVKAKAARTKDDAALEQAAEHLRADDVSRALAWADESDPGTTEDLRLIVRHARERRAPKRTVGYPHKRR
jgi:hypothetical protein